MAATISEGPRRVREGIDIWEADSSDGSRPGQREKRRYPLNPSTSSFAETASRSAPTRETETLVDVGPLVVPDPQAAKLTQPANRALSHPAKAAQSTPVLGAADGQQGTM